MNQELQRDWDPKSETVQNDQIAAYDEMRKRCPVAYSDYLLWSVFRHEDVLRMLNDHETFSNAASSHLSVPNGMDPPEHTEHRRIIEPYFGPERMQAFEPVCRDIAAKLARRLSAAGEIELMAEFAQTFALQVQCAFMGWPMELQEPLRQWTDKKNQATLAQDRTALAAITREFNDRIRGLLDVRREAGAAAPDDITTQLLHDKVWGRPLTDEEIASILRNWTVGEVGTIAACVGILAHYLAEHPALQQQLRGQPALLPAAIDEILRINAPLIANRRTATKPVEIEGRKLNAGARISIIWASANRDETVFGDPDEFRLDRDPKLNLLYGAGIHVCPGAPLARLELRIIMEELLNATRKLELVPDKAPVNAAYPAGGFSSLPLQIQ